MILWCKLCGAFMGLRDPISDWSTDRGAICAYCAEKVVDTVKPEVQKDKNDHDSLPKEANQS